LLSNAAIPIQSGGTPYLKNKVQFAATITFDSLSLLTSSKIKDTLAFVELLPGANVVKVK